MLVAVTWTQLLVHAAAVAAGNGDNDPTARDGRQ